MDYKMVAMTNNNKEKLQGQRKSNAYYPESSVQTPEGEGERPQCICF